MLRGCFRILKHVSKFLHTLIQSYAKLVFTNYLKLRDHLSKNASSISNICFKCLQQLLQHCVNISFIFSTNTSKLLVSWFKLAQTQNRNSPQTYSILPKHCFSFASNILKNASTLLQSCSKIAPTNSSKLLQQSCKIAPTLLQKSSTHCSKCFNLLPKKLNTP